MAKTKEELNALKQEYESLTTKLQELNDDELNLVTGGFGEGLKETLRIRIRGISTIGTSSPMCVVDEIDKGDPNWKSENEIPAQPGHYKIG